MDEDKKEELRDDCTEQRETDDSGGDSGDSNGVLKSLTSLSHLAVFYLDFFRLLLILL